MVRWEASLYVTYVDDTFALCEKRENVKENGKHSIQYTPAYNSLYNMKQLSS